MNAVKRAAPFKVTQDDVEHMKCLLEALPTLNFRRVRGQKQWNFFVGISKYFQGAS